MARFVQHTYPLEHAGLIRVTRGLEAIAGIDRSLSRALLRALASIGRPVTAAAGKVAARFAGWTAARKQAVADRQLWNLALTDARVMADLSRAMSDEARRIGA